jgi:hypothetical protein
MGEMPNNEYIEIKGLERILRRLDQLPRQVMLDLDAALKAGLNNIKSHFDYPPASAANRPKYGSWGPYYERGIGSAYKRKRDGSVTQYFNSERLSAGWSQRVSYGPYMIEAVLGNRVSYGPYVHSAAQQADFHAARGWKTAEDAMRAERAGIIQLVSRAVDRSLQQQGW